MNPCAAGCLSSYARSAQTGLWLNAAPISAPTGLYLGYYTMTEVSANGYARVPVPASTWTTTGATTTNVSAITFPAVTGANWPTLVSAFLADAPTGGNIIYNLALSVPANYAVGQTPMFDPGAIKLT